jgi:hypothetical protein
MHAAQLLLLHVDLERGSSNCSREAETDTMLSRALRRLNAGAEGETEHQAHCATQFDIQTETCLKFERKEFCIAIVSLRNL